MRLVATHHIIASRVGEIREAGIISHHSNVFRAIPIGLWGENGCEKERAKPIVIPRTGEQLPKAFHILVRTIQGWPLIVGPVVGDTDKKCTSLRPLAVALVLFIVRKAYISSRVRHTKWPTKAAGEKCFDKGDHTRHTTEFAHLVLFR
jgi:hypothetical protein